jgi:hypothetical protein
MPSPLYKTFLLVVVALFTLAANAQSTWPRNPQTNKIEFVGSLPWPPEAKTTKQREALVRRWYDEKLSDTKLADTKPDDIQEPKTCCDIPGEARVRYIKGDQRFGLNFNAQFVLTTSGLSYRLFNFDFAFSEDDTSANGYLEDALIQTAEQPSFVAAFATMRARLATATAGW